MFVFRKEIKQFLFDFAVTPCAGVWIEIINYQKYYPITIVTPCAGVWIEIILPCTQC